MGLSLLDRLMRRSRPSVSAAVEPDLAVTMPVAPASGTWSPQRLAQAEGLWGEGFTWPGGADDIKRLLAPCGLSAAHTLLMVGAGAGGPARTLAAELGTWVAGYEADAVLREAAERRVLRAGTALAKRATIAALDVAAPGFTPRGYHHAVLLDVLDRSSAAGLLAAAVQAVKPAGQIIVVQTVRSPAEDAAIVDTLEREGCDIRVVEDESARHARLVLQGWKLLLRRLRESRPAPQEAAALVQEAAGWLYRLRGIREGRIRVMRWCALVG